jgi:threonine/homoserine/homoserine lactone efflux protein
MPRNETTLILLAVVVVCAVSVLRGLLASVTSIPMASQTLQLAGLTFITYLLWMRVTRGSTPDPEGTESASVSITDKVKSLYTKLGL